MLFFFEFYFWNYNIITAFLPQNLFIIPLIPLQLMATFYMYLSLLSLHIFRSITYSIHNACSSLCRVEALCIFSLHFDMYCALIPLMFGQSCWCNFWYYEETILFNKPSVSSLPWLPGHALLAWLSLFMWRIRSHHSVEMTLSCEVWQVAKPGGEAELEQNSMVPFWATLGSDVGEEFESRCWAGSWTQRFRTVRNLARRKTRTISLLLCERMSQKIMT